MLLLFSIIFYITIQTQFFFYSFFKFVYLLKKTEGEEEQVLQSSLISQVAQTGWNKLMSPIPFAFQDNENLNTLITLLIDCLRDLMSSIGLLWFKYLFFSFLYSLCKNIYLIMLFYYPNYF